MAQKTWNITTADGQQHTVTLEHGFFSGKRTIRIDGNVMHHTENLFDAGSLHDFKIGKSELTVVIMQTWLWFIYDLIVDGISQETQSPAEPVYSYPIWIWPIFTLSLPAVYLAWGEDKNFVSWIGIAIIFTLSAQMINYSKYIYFSEKVRIGIALAMLASAWVTLFILQNISA